VPRTTGCADCGYERCLCHSCRCVKCGQPVDRLRVYGCKCHERSEDVETRAATGIQLVLRSVEPVDRDGLMLQGIATTRDWNAIEVRLAAGLVRLDGSTTTRRAGLVPRKLQAEPPYPLLWKHDWAKPIGQVFELSATDLELHFRACIASPGTPGYDTTLLMQAWAEVRAGVIAGVSIWSDGLPAADGSWRLKELSVGPKGGNRFARITRATFPDGHVVEHGAKPITREAAQRAWLEFEEAQRLKQSAGPLRAGHQGLVTKVGRIVRDSRGNATIEITEITPPGSAPSLERTRSVDSDDEQPPDRWRGIWAEGKQYRRGDTATYGGALWYAHRETTSKPGTSPDWQLMAKSHGKNEKPNAGAA
jgi:hypothetical protein